MEDAPGPRDWSFPMMRWDELAHLYARALEEGVKLRDDPDHPGLFALATSGTTKGVEYRVNEFTCACKAGENGMDCKHRALFLVEHMARLGRIFFTEGDDEQWSGSSSLSPPNET